MRPSIDPGTSLTNRSDPRRNGRLAHGKFAPLVGIVVAIVTLVWLLLPVWTANFPPLPSTMTFEITFPAGIAGRGEPIITTGVTEDGDFLAVRYVNDRTAVLFYDVWGVGGPTSAEFEVKPGQRRVLEVEMPTLAHVAQVVPREKRPLRVTLDGETLLNDRVFFHRRKPAEIFFATNPIGGTLAGPRFRGELAFPSGRVIAGGPEEIFGWGKRIIWVAQHHWRTLLRHGATALALGTAAGWLFPRRSRFRPPQLSVDRNRSSASVRFSPPHLWFGVTVAVCTAAFVAVLTNGTFRLFVADEFSSLYDFQARSFLQGRLALPDEARTGESFIFEGRNYMYFGPTPALLRLPLAVMNIGFGAVGRCFMVGYYLALLAAVYAVLIFVARLAGGSKAWPSRKTVVLMVSTVGLSTPFFFLSSRTYIYHEAILSGAMLAVWSGYFTLRYLAEPHRKWWIGALACGLFSVHARPPSGLFALVLVGCAAAVILIRQWLNRERTSGREAASALRAIRQPILVGIGSVLSVLSFNGLSYLKFKSFEGAPLKYHVQYQEGRLAAIDGKNFHLSNFRFNFNLYMWRPDFVLRKTFPYFFIQNSHDHFYPKVKNDLYEPTLALPYTMPALVFLAIVGGGLAFAVWPEARIALGVVAVAGTLMSLTLFTAVAVSHRYTADFCPALILIGAFGVHALEWLSTFWRRSAMTLTTLFAVSGVAVTVALTLHYQGAVVWGVPKEVPARYEHLRTTVDRLLGFSP